MAAIGMAIAAFCFFIAWKSRWTTASRTPGVSRESVPPRLELESVEPSVREYLRGYLERAQERPEDPERRAELALALAGNRQWSAALDHFLDAAARSPSSPLPFYYVGVAKRELGRADEALDQFREATLRYPDFAPGFHSLAVALLEAGQYDAAKDAYRRTVELLPDSPDGYLGLADVHIAQHAAAEALSNVDQALARDPRNAHAHYVRGLALRGLGRREEAMQELALGVQEGRGRIPDPWTPALVRHDQSLTGRLTQARTLDGSGRADEARELLLATVAAHPNEPDPYLALAVVEQKQRRFREALGHATRAYQLASERTEVVVRYVLCLDAVGEAAEASKVADELLRSDPDSSDAHYLKARLLRGEDDLEKRLHHLQKAAEQEPANSMMQTDVGVTLMRLRRPEEAVKRLSIAVECDPRNTLAYLNLAAAFEQVGRVDEAERILRRARIQWPADARVISFLERLSSQKKPGS